MSNYTDIVKLLQFTIEVEDNCYTCLLNMLAERNINIRAIADMTVNCKRYVKFVVNTPGQEQGIEALNTTRQILRQLNICFSEQVVLSVGIPNLPGQLAAIQALFFGKVIVRASYIDETLDQIYEVNDVDLAERILRNASLEPIIQPDCSACAWGGNQCLPCIPVHQDKICFNPRKDCHEKRGGNECCKKKKHTKKSCSSSSNH